MNLLTAAVLICAFAISVASCTEPQKSNSSNQIDATEKGNSYKLTIDLTKFDPKVNAIRKVDSVIEVLAPNDTVAYLQASKTFYNQRIVQRKESNYGEPKSFLITDKNGLDLAIKLPKVIVARIKKQVSMQPEVARMLEEYRRDSMPQ